MTTQTFRAPILRRPVDVTGSSTVTTQQPTPTAFDDGYGSGFDGWFAEDMNGDRLSAPTVPTDLLTAVTIVLSEQSPRFPPFDFDRGGYPEFLYAIRTDGRSVLTWPITGVTNRLLGGQIIARAVGVSAPTEIVGSGDIVAFGTNYDVTAVPITVDTVSRLLADIAERGQTATLEVDGIQVRLDTDAGDMEYAAIRTRYLAAAAIGSTITDDLGRVWTVNGSSTLGNRQYLEFQCSRSIGGTPDRR